MSKEIKKTNLPILTPEGSFDSYLQKIRKFPMLDAAEEYILAKNAKARLSGPPDTPTIKSCSIFKDLSKLL